MPHFPGKMFRDTALEMGLGTSLKIDAYLNVLDSNFKLQMCCPPQPEQNRSSERERES